MGRLYEMTKEKFRCLIIEDYTCTRAAPTPEEIVTVPEEKYRIERIRFSVRNKRDYIPVKYKIYFVDIYEGKEITRPISIGVENGKVIIITEFTGTLNAGEVKEFDVMSRSSSWVGEDVILRVICESSLLGYGYRLQDSKDCISLFTTDQLVLSEFLLKTAPPTAPPTPTVPFITPIVITPISH